MTTIWGASKNAHAVLSNGSLTAATDGAATHCVGVATASAGTGVKRYWEAQNNISAATHEAGAGLANASQTFVDNDFLGNSAFSIGAYNDGAVYKNYSGTVTQFATVGSFIAGQTQCFATFGGKLWIRIDNGGWNNDILANQDPANNIGGLDISDLGTVFPAFDVQNTGKLTANFGSTNFAFTPPAGFTGFDIPPVFAGPKQVLKVRGRRLRKLLVRKRRKFNVAGTVVAQPTPVVSASKRVLKIRGKRTLKALTPGVRTTNDRKRRKIPPLSATTTSIPAFARPKKILTLRGKTRKRRVVVRRRVAPFVAPIAPVVRPFSASKRVLKLRKVKAKSRTAVSRLLIRRHKLKPIPRPPTPSVVVPAHGYGSKRQRGPKYANLYSDFSPKPIVGASPKSNPKAEPEVNPKATPPLITKDPRADAEKLLQTLAAERARAIADDDEEALFALRWS